MQPFFNKNLNSNLGGDHYVCELFSCDPLEINDEKFLKDIFLNLLENTEAKILNSYFHTFSPQGVTGFVLLSASHISFHTWPEHGYVAFDVFTCTSQKEAKNITESICNSIRHASRKIRHIRRGYSF